MVEAPRKVLELVPHPVQTHNEALLVIKAFIGDAAKYRFTGIVCVGTTREGPVVMRYMTSDFTALLAAISRVQRDVLAADDETDVKDIKP